MTGKRDPLEQTVSDITKQVARLQNMHHQIAELLRKFGNDGEAARYEASVELCQRVIAALADIYDQLDPPPWIEPSDRD